MIIDEIPIYADEIVIYIMFLSPCSVFKKRTGIRMLNACLVNENTRHYNIRNVVHVT